MNKSNCDWFYHLLLIIHTFAVTYTYRDNDVIRYTTINDDFKVCLCRRNIDDYQFAQLI